MVISPEKVDAYLRAKGIPSHMSDSQWESAIVALRPFFDTGRWYKVKLLHQKEDALGRWNSLFPESIPAPYRFIDYIQFVAGGLMPEVEIVEVLKELRVPFVTSVESNGPEEDDVVTIIRVGPQQMK
jgi:hypothetical protein